MDYFCDINNKIKFKTEIMTRAEHLQWCKDRANEMIDNGHEGESFASFMSDMLKHDETANHLALDMGMSLLIAGHLSTEHEMRNWINGFN